ncbi:hypothetical protein JRQ81_015595 [Phrynocephalus forsythii]|uniref:Uncharacterized protein n=1 Tax=Phrynocephalus forsythii TaxID=171643 RepID=A0A9Q1B1K0_9SAUR|nr:hypothetical protein JRQ81_015595 [Phrynocephalus forsythii]
MEKEERLSKECSEVEELDAKQDSFNVYKKIRQAAGVYNSRGSESLIDKNGNTLTSTKEKLQEWKEYIEHLFKDNRSTVSTMVSS